MTFIALKNDTERIICKWLLLHWNGVQRKTSIVPGKNKKRCKLINWMIFYYLFDIIEKLYSKYETLKGFRLDEFTNLYSL